MVQEKVEIHLKNPTWGMLFSHISSTLNGHDLTYPFKNKASNVIKVDVSRRLLLISLCCLHKFFLEIISLNYIKCNEWMHIVLTDSIFSSIRELISFRKFTDSDMAFLSDRFKVSINKRFKVQTKMINLNWF